MMDDRIDSYMETLEDRAIRDAERAAEAIGTPTDLYADLWDKTAAPERRLKLASTLVGDMFRNGVPAESIAHIFLATTVMLAHQYRGDPE